MSKFEPRFAVGVNNSLWSWHKNCSLNLASCSLIPPARRLFSNFIFSLPESSGTGRSRFEQLPPPDSLMCVRVTLFAGWLHYCTTERAENSPRCYFRCSKWSAGFFSRFNPARAIFSSRYELKLFSIYLYNHPRSHRSVEWMHFFFFFIFFSYFYQNNPARN